jgi:hypothetical protein
MEFVLSLKINELYHFIKILENTENTVKILFQHLYIQTMHLYQLSHNLSSNILFKEKYPKGQFKSGSLMKI